MEDAFKKANQHCDDDSNEKDSKSCETTAESKWFAAVIRTDLGLGRILGKNLMHSTSLTHVVHVKIEDSNKGRVLLITVAKRFEVVLARDWNNGAILILLERPRIVKKSSVNDTLSLVTH